MKTLFGKNSESSSLPKKHGKQRLSSRLAEILDSSKAVFLIVMITIWAVAVLILVLPSSKNDDSPLVIGQISPLTYFSEFDFSLVDEKKTFQLKESASSKAPAAYRLDEEIIEENMKTAKIFLDELARKSELVEKNELYKGRQGSRASALVAELSPDAVKILSMLNQSEEKKKAFLNEIEKKLSLGILKDQNEKMDEPYKKILVKDSDNYTRKEKRLMDIPHVSQALADINDAVSKNYSIENREMLKENLAGVLAGIVEGNLVFDRDSSEALMQNARNSVQPVMMSFKKGDVLIRKGSVVGDETLDLYKAYAGEKNRVFKSEFMMKRFINYLIICFLLLVVIGIYLKHIHPEIYRSNKLITLTATVIVVNILANAGMIRLFEHLGGIFNLSPLIISSVLPLSMASLILSVMLGLRAGLYAGLFVALIAALQLENSFDIIINGLVVSAISGLAIRHAPNHRAYFLRAALSVSLTIPLMEALHIWHTGGGLELISKAAVLGLANGLVISALSLALIFIFEAIFQMSTEMSLLVLCDYNHPLLKKLQIEAPGTYHHSLMVASLAEQAAREIGASPIKARACALFHDIGKLQMPVYFTENCMGGDDKHEDLNPKISTIVIQNHVKEGIKLAKKYKLRKIIKDAIEQHHGTDLVGFFYQRAKNDNIEDSDNVQESDYKYPGPLPHEKEVVIVGLADACEAASRSISKPNPAKIAELINELVRKRIRDGQLEDAQITLGELGKIKCSFVKTLTQMMHGRIAYPREQEQDEDDLFKQSKKTAGSED